MASPRVPHLVSMLALLAALAVGMSACSSPATSDDTNTGGNAQATTQQAQAADTGAANAAAGVRHLSPADFAAAIQQQGTVLIDVRTPAEFAAGHLRGAQNIDVSAADFAQRVAALDKAGSYALYCRTGVRSNTAAQQLLGAGFTKVVDLAGGITAWANEGREVTTA